MKGIVFTELLEMVEERYSLEVVDRIIERAELPSGGVYTAVGTYPPEEMGRLLRELSAATGAPPAELLRAFGHHLLHRFAAGFPQFFAESKGALALLERVETVIHVEVRKLYPDAELPSFDTARDGDRLTMVYRSPRRLSHLAEGLIAGCAEFYGETIDVEREDLSGGDGEVVRFTLTRRAAS